MEAHSQAVLAISKRLREFYARREPFRVYHGSTNSTRAIRKDGDKVIDTSRLDSVLAIDKAEKTALVEPNVSMAKLVAAALEHGLVPLVVMEFPGITAGGGFSGSAGESSSGRHGPFDSTVSAIEIVVPNGDVLRASKTDRPDLFWGAASAFGTLGIVTLLEIQLRNAAPYVRLTHYPVHGFSKASEMLQDQVADASVDFVDGIVFSCSKIVVCAGRLVETLPSGSQVRRYLGRRDPWFYLDVQKRAMDSSPSAAAVVDYVPLVDYLFRWDRGGFWVARYAYRYFLTPFNRITRYALDDFMHARVMYHALHESGLSDTYIIQDAGVPFHTAPAFYDWLHENTRIHPLWLCPIRVRRHTSDAAHGIHADFADPRTPELMLNFGVWGPGPKDYDAFVRLNRELERKVHELGGKKTLYAQTYYTEAEFWDSYNKPAYDDVRAKYHADHLPCVYDKVRTAGEKSREPSRVPSVLRHRRPFQGLYGVYKAWLGGDYQLQKKGSKPG